MKIAVCVKEVPDTTAEKRIDPSTFRLVRTEGDRMLNEFDKYAVEEAIRLKEAGTADEVILVSLGPEKAVESLRQALAMGADRLVLVSDPAAAGSDYLGTARALAKAIDETGAELVLLGAEATDARSGVLTATLGEISGRTWVTSANSIAVNGSSITIERQSDDGVATVEAPLPAVVSVTKAINEPRYPSLKGIMGAKKKPQEVKSLGDIGLAASDVGEAGAKTKVVGVETPPARTAGVVVTDEGNGAQQILDFLIDKKLI
ncbi:MAG: electron transfer flavoprotein subunit beta/FixA family protein [Thermoleophilia bacterium]|nr:electron transfer flavoprotein subunit beta/FixA family protein [Actinomycetota bacterium]